MQKVYVIEYEGKPIRSYLKEGTAKSAMKQLYGYAQEPDKYSVETYIKS